MCAAAQGGASVAFDPSSGLTRLVRAVTELASARSVDDVVEIVRGTARVLTGADGATFVLRDGDRCHYVEEDAISPLWRGSKFPIETCISGWAMLNRRAAVIEDIYADDRIPHDAYRPTFVRSLVMVPVRTADPIAAIGNYWAEPHLATTAEVELLQALADSTAVALENVRVMEALERMVEERTKELLEANRDLKHFGSAVAHDLSSPLAAIRGFSELLRRDLADRGERDEQAWRHADAIERNIDRASELIGDLLAYSRSGEMVPRLEAVDIAGLVHSTLERLGPRIAEKGATVTVGPLADVTADASLLGQVVQNLLVNALNHGGGHVTIGADQVDGTWTLAVADDGPGIPEAEWDVVFQPFERGSSHGDHPGSGLGLAICRRISEQHGGRIRVQRSAAGGAEFVVSLPA